MIRISLHPTAILVLVLLCAPMPPARAADAPPDSPGIDFFEKKIRPILVDHCFECHSAKSEELKGKLRLDTREGVLKGGETGTIVIPGDPDSSLLIKAVRYKYDKLQMPPDEKLSDADIADLAAWVKMGAPDPRSAIVAATAPTTEPIDLAALAQARKQWAFSKPQDHPLPHVNNATWIRQPLDRFVLAKLEEKNLAPAPQADRRTLIRRAYFDLIGLPPSPQDVEAFVNDSSPDAYANLIDKLLASPLYGQRWARHWLDVVRYTDSFDSRVLGNEMDVAFAWRYRDWVVDSFNKDLPYDAFLTQQIAGDLLPAPKGKSLNKDALIATGVYVLGEWGGGDSDKDKLITDIVDDQVDLTSRAFMGLTVSCARCHDHKFDPISTRDYYGLAGIFFSTHILPEPGPKTAGPTNLRIPLLDDQDKAKRKADETRVAQLTEEMEKTRDAQYAAMAAEVLPQSDKYLVAAWEYEHTARSANVAGGAGGAAATPARRPPIAQFAQEHGLNAYALDRWIAFIGTPDLKLLTRREKDVSGFKGINAWRNAEGGDTPAVVVNTTNAVVETMPYLKLPARSVNVHPSPAAGIAVAWKSPFAGRVKISGKVADVHESCGDGITWSFSRISGKAPGELASGSIPNGGDLDLRDGVGGTSLASVPVSEGEFLQLAILPKAEYTCDTTNITLEITEIGGQKRIWNLAKDVLATDHNPTNPSPDSYGNATVWHFHDMIAQSQATLAAGSPMTRYLRSTVASGDETSVHKVAKELVEALRGIDAQVHKSPDKANDTSIARSPMGSFHQLLTAPRGPFWSAARTDDANLPPPVRQQMSTRRTEQDKLKENLAQPIPVAQAMQEGGTPKSMFAGIQDVPVHIRGRYDRLGDLVPRHFPRVIADDNQKPITKGSGRLELARWLTSPDHPLTARVIVNRIWQQHFGDGIVRTPNNFGKLGIPPTHPELLDYLAINFVRSGWSIKALHRSIMLSATYMQSSEPSPDAYKADPENKLLARMNRRKLEAEALRDSMLSVAGTLDTAAGGPAINDLATPRRSLYVMTIRSDRSNYRTLFDAADPAAIVEKRNDSTVAPQALFLMNHPFVLDRAKQLAARATREAGSDDAARIDWLYRTLFARPPEPKELEIAKNFFSRNKTETNWQAYCQILLCANEFMYVD